MAASRRPALGETFRRLQKAGYLRAEDIAFIQPLDYCDETQVVPLASAPLGVPVLVEVECVEQRVHNTPSRQLLSCLVKDDTASMHVQLMNFNPSIRRLLEPGQRLRLLGEINSRSSRTGLFASSLEMIHPGYRPVDQPLSEHMTPRYPRIAKIAAANLASIIERTYAFMLANWPDPLPASLRQATGTLDFQRSLQLLHKPGPDEHARLLPQALASLKFDEWLAHMLMQRKQRLLLRRKEISEIPNSPEDLQRFAGELPFELTAAQRKAMAQIGADLNQTHVMRRLIHGDVGCGKTLVAAFACWLAAKNRRRSAIMCPTVILAGQHFARLEPLLDSLGVRTVLLDGTVKGRRRREVMAAIEEHPNTVVIGTHALFQKDVLIPDLALAVIDEQQRFGVAQRRQLESKSGAAHILMMSATPIPRTLELGMLSFLDLTRIDELPHPRSTRTLVFSADRVHEILDRIVSNDLQTYWICPLVRATKATEQLRAAEQEYERIRRLAPGIEVGLIHGRMKPADKTAAMRRFEAGQTRLMVATTVVEVGVDAQEADVIVIDHAERLGLSQLHQLRGRVGRGSKQGFCALLYEPDLSETSVQRLKIMHETADGFEIAKQDLMLRGPGDIVGKRQSGDRKYRFASLDDDIELLEQARQCAEDVLDEDKQAAQEHVQLWLGKTRAPPVSRPESPAGRRPGKTAGP